MLNQINAFPTHSLILIAWCVFGVRMIYGNILCYYSWGLVWVSISSAVSDILQREEVQPQEGSFNSTPGGPL